MDSRFDKIFHFLARIGADVGDDEELKLQKSLLVLSTFPFMVAGAGWGILYLYFGEIRAGLIPLSYSVISLFSVLYFGRNLRFEFFRFSQLLLILLLPFFLMLALGGFVKGSAVILWGLISPLGALLFDTRERAPRWFMAYLLLVLVSGFLEPWLDVRNNLNTWQINFFFTVNLGSVGALIFLMVSYFVREKNLFQQKSESLLLNILPKEIVTKLKQGHQTIAEHYDSASILFADVVNFTPVSATLTPSELIELLNAVFQKFDELADKYGVEKIKTIGDCYMAAAGVPRPRKDHAVILTAMAVEMRDYIRQHDFLGKKLQFRFGINSGPLIAGVIGSKKFSYDLWGDSVNIASRMESHGTGGLIQITQATYELVKDHFTCTSLGTVQVKGKGEMHVWEVVHRI
ncbi:MAG TPA: adenylate/guanylate cyclase domain-containing protein [Saprospiraceae bacterium]|nr:adenylate/guanylate cyclase domain-containing protein [Saprospiraceae bacterium]HNT20272.1 adenylate/guanylate cyclase domain-containing protein [Saprospiraceae bacterium]